MLELNPDPVNLNPDPININQGPNNPHCVLVLYNQVIEYHTKANSIFFALTKILLNNMYMGNIFQIRHYFQDEFLYIHTISRIISILL